MVMRVFGFSSEGEVTFSTTLLDSCSDIQLESKLVMLRTWRGIAGLQYNNGAVSH
jgi:hypothetical protein